MTTQEKKIPISKNTIQIEFSDNIPSPKNSPSHVLTSNVLQHHVFLSSLLLEETNEEKSFVPTKIVEKTPIEHDFNMFKLHLPILNQSSSSSLSSYNQTKSPSSPLPKPSIQKQAHDVHLLIQQYYQYIRNRIAEYSSQLELSLDYSNYETSSDEGKSQWNRKPMVETVLYLIEAHWFMEWETAIVNKDDTSLAAFIGPINNEPLVFERVKSVYSAEDKLAQEIPLRQDLIEDSDYVLVPKEVWEALKSWYGGGDPVISRKGWVSFDKSFPSEVIITNNNNDNNNNHEKMIKSSLKISSSHFAEYIPGGKLSLEIYPKKPFTEADSMIFHDMMTTTVMATATATASSFSSPHRSSQMSEGSLSPKASSIRPPSSTSSTSSLTSFTSMKPSKSVKPMVNYIFNDVGTSSSDIKKRCYLCHRYSKFKCAKCFSVHYCDKNCQQIHWKYHKSWCASSLAHKDLPISQFQLIVPIGRRGKVGLLNLGNSCYMNSSLQCISHISSLVGDILSERFLKDINKENRDGTGGILVNEFHELLKELWLDNKSTFSPVGIKRILGRTNSDYAGVQQHDAHEVTMLLLDKLHEDLNRISKKPYTESPEGDGMNDEFVFREAWQKHLSREDSIVQDLIGGAVRNEINCRICKKTVVKFDSQYTVQLAIPKNNMRTIYVLYIPSNREYKYNIEKASNGHRVSTNGSSNSSNGGYSDSNNNNSNNSDIDSEIIPKLLALTVDKHTTIKQLKLLLLAQHSSILSSSSSLLGKDHDNDNIVTIENMITFVANKNTNLLRQFVDGSDSIKLTVPTDSYLTLYMKDEKQDTTTQSYVVLIQRMISPVKGISNGSVLHIPEQYNINAVGLPILLSIINSWSCLRVRILLLQQIERYFLPNSIIQKLYNQFTAELGPIKGQVKLANYLPVRFVDSHGRGLYIPDIDRMYPDTGMAKENEELYSYLGMNLSESYGSWFPADNNRKLADILNIINLKSDILFLAVDWSHRWLESLHEEESDKVLIASATHLALQDNIVNNQVITISPIRSIHASAYSSIHPSKSMLNQSQNSNLNSIITARISDLILSPSKANVSAISLEQCLREHTKSEVLDNGNEWYCSNCKTHQKATKQVTFWRGKLPNVLILSLKRFEFRGTSPTSSPETSSRYNNMFGNNNSGGHREKIEDFVDFPLEGLDLGPFCHNQSNSHMTSSSTLSYDNLSDLGGVYPNNTNGNNNNGKKKPTALYDLFAICNHYGRMGFGHYTAFARDYVDDQISSQWYSFDDDVVRPCTNPEEVKTRAAYILFYRKRPN